MSSSEFTESPHESHWLDDWWPLFLILFGVSFVLLLALFPQTAP